MKTTRFAGLAVLLVVLLAACSAPATPPDDSNGLRLGALTGTTWRVVTVNGRTPVAGGEPTATFTATQVTGSAGCNQYGGGYAFDASTGAIGFADMRMTAMACAEPARNDFESLFTQTMRQATSAAVDPAGRLVLSGPAGQVVLVLDRQRAVEG
jgi:heat shock protein HslJ